MKIKNNKISFSLYDLPSDHGLQGDIALDTETLGLVTKRDRLCLVQLADEKGNIHLVHFPDPNYDAPNLKQLLNDGDRTFICHFARFDLAAVSYYLGAQIDNVFCTKIGSLFARTYTGRHGLKDLVRDLLSLEMDKSKQLSNWSDDLEESQISYASDDVRYLHMLRFHLIKMLKKSERLDLANECFAFLPARVKLDLAGWEKVDIFSHNPYI